MALSSCDGAKIARTRRRFTLHSFTTCISAFLFARLFLCSRHAIIRQFDIVSEDNPLEIENAVRQAKKAPDTRFDFKGGKVDILLKTNDTKLFAEDHISRD